MGLVSRIKDEDCGFHDHAKRRIDAFRRLEEWGREVEPELHIYKYPIGSSPREMDGHVQIHELNCYEQALATQVSRL